MIPGFPTDRFVAFALAIPFLQGALFATMNAGTDLARDIQTGFLNRLSLTPMRGVGADRRHSSPASASSRSSRRSSTSPSATRSACTRSRGAGGIAVLLVLAVAIAIGFGAVGLFMALRTGSGEAVQGLFPVLFVFLLISSMNFPRNLIEADWFRWAATVNPVSYLIEGIRSLMIEGWNGEALGLAFAITAGLIAVALARLGVRPPREDDAHVTRDFRIGGARGRLADDPQRPAQPVAALPRARLPAAQLRRLRGRPLAPAPHRRASTTRPATPASSSASSCSSRPRSAASSPGFGIARDFEYGFSRRLMLAAANRRAGSSPATRSAPCRAG